MTQIDYDQRKRERERSDLICYPQSKGKIYDDRTQDGLWRWMARGSNLARCAAGVLVLALLAARASLAEKIYKIMR